MARLDKESMIQFLQSYDVTRQKYFWDMDSVPADIMQSIAMLNKRCTVTDMAWNIEKAQNTYLTVKDVYNDDMKDYLGVLQIALEKFVFDFVNIEGIHQLCEASYFYFEWMMHLEYSPDRHDYMRYRDHYIHQVKNMYEMLVLLDNLKYMDYCIDAYQKGSNLIANQIRASIDEQIRAAEAQQEKTLFSLFRKLEREKAGGMSEVNVRESAKKRMREYCYRYLIHAVSVVAALTHDIGYPITYMLRTAAQLHSFLPLSEAFLHLNDAMPHLEQILQDSLLYRTVKPEEIARRIKEKKDHGAVSAVILLSKYYETGAIYHLQPIERTVIELSAVVVYNHTVKYGCMTGKKEQPYRNLFEDNPISYLFRLCDDIQEWGRVYFDISQKSNFLTCPRCHLPIKRDAKAKIISYSCGCGKSGIRRTQFPYRKMTNIAACRAVEIRETAAPAPDRRRLTMNMEYDLVSLLQLSLYYPGFARFRADGVYEVKRMLDGQKIIPQIYIRTFLTNNPLAIKVECLERFLGSLKKQEGFGKEIWREWQDKCQLQIINLFGKTQGSDGSKRSNKQFWLGIVNQDFSNAAAVIRRVCDREGWNYDSRSRLWINTKQKWKENLKFYFFLSVIGKDVEVYRKKGYFPEREDAISFSGELADRISSEYKIKDRYTTALIRDYIWQRIRDVTEEEFFNNQAHEYYEEAMLSNQAMSYAVEEYVDSEAYERVREELGKKTPENLEGVYDFYTDYELFSAMAQYESYPSAEKTPFYEQK